MRLSLCVGRLLGQSKWPGLGGAKAAAGVMQRPRDWGAERDTVKILWPLGGHEVSECVTVCVCVCLLHPPLSLFPPPNANE